MTFDLNLTVDVGPHLSHLLKRIFPKQRGQQLTISGGDIMFVLPDDQADAPFTISPVTATDAEGNKVALAELLKSDNESVVSFTFDEGSTATSPRSGKAHFGSPGTASVLYTASDPANTNTVFKSSGAQFTITTGAVDPASVSGGDLVFEGITEQPTPEPLPEG